MRRSAVRSVILAIAAIWFLIQAFARIEGDSTHEVVALGQRIAFGLVLVALALIDWEQFRWWWLVVGVLALVIVWMATGHPLLFLFGFV